MIHRISKMPSSILIILAWIVVWCVVATKNAAPSLCGKGISCFDGEYYRFFTAGLTHTHVLHCFFNVAAMFWLGCLYEERIGSVKFLLLGVVCAVLTQVIFLCIYRYTSGSIGGSGYNYALCGFVLTMQLLVPDFPKMQYGTWGGNWLIYSLLIGNIPIFSFMNVTTLIFHVIAFVIGALAALVCKLLSLT